MKEWWQTVDKENPYLCKLYSSMIYTGYIDSERQAIKVGDYMASEEEHFVGMVIDHKQGFRLSYSNGTYDDLKDVDNKYHIVTEEYTNYLHELKVESDYVD